jgi:hypothetical protein
MASFVMAMAASGMAGAQPAPAPAPAMAQPVAPFVEGEARAAVEALATALDDNFVFPEIGDRYAAALRAKLASGGYARFESADAFAKAITADLQAIHADGHLRLFAPEPRKAGEAPRRMGPQPDTAIGKSGWLADGVAYIDFRGFPGDPATLQRLRTFLDGHATARTLIIDARRHGGGGLAEMDVMFPLFFGKEQVLVQMDTRSAVEERHGSPIPEGPTLVRAQGPKEIVRRSHKVIPAAQANGLRSARIFLLTSKRTGSAAEHLALSLKRTGRATLIGETTAGAGHFGGVAPMGEAGYLAFIPVGRTFDPDTGQGWEGVGVKPDVEVPADKALDEALKRAGVRAGAAKDLASL